MLSSKLVFGLGVASLAVLMTGAPRKLVWSDEFAGPAGGKPDPTKWTYDVGVGLWGNKELENYTSRTENVHLDGYGHLVIRALKDAGGGYSSARLKTEGLFEFKYGRVEARMKLPKGQGMWPAFWMLGNDYSKIGWPKCGEVDVMENLGREPAIVHGTVHGPGRLAARGISAEYELPGRPALSDDFHVYAADWKPDQISFSIDDHTYATVRRAALPSGTAWAYDHPFFLLLNLAVGGEWPGNPDSTTVFPQELLVDYVRVYE